MDENKFAVAKLACCQGVKYPPESINDSRILRFAAASCKIDPPGRRLHSPPAPLGACKAQVMSHK